MQKQEIIRYAAAAALACAGVTSAIAGVDQLQWLEAPQDPKALAWAKEQTDTTRKTLSSKPAYQKIRAELSTALAASPPLAEVVLLGSRAIRLQKSAAHPHGELQVAPRLSGGGIGAWKTVLDVDALGREEGKSMELHLAGLSGFAKNCLAPAYRYCLLPLAPSGGDETELREFDLVGGQFVKAGFRTPASHIQSAWLDKDRVLIAHALGDSPRTSAGWGAAVRLWSRGTPVEKAPIVYEAKASDAILTLDRLGEGKHVRGLIQRIPDYSTFDLSLVDLAGVVKPVSMPTKLKPFGVKTTTQRYIVVQLAEGAEIGGVAYPAESLLSYDTAQSTPSARRVGAVYQPKDGEYVGGGFGDITGTANEIAFVLKRGLAKTIQLATPGKTGWALKEVYRAAPGMNVSFDSADFAGHDLVFRTQGFIEPAQQRLLQGGKVARELGKEPAAFDASNLMVETRQARSKDGTSVDYYLVRPRNIKVGSSTPTLMTGYGAFGITMEPGYLDAVIGGKGTKLWFERGGALVLPAIRGGGDRGETWHKAAMREHRQNSYDDFIAVAEDLVKSGFVKPKQIGVFGTSNGGLLAATIGLQRPDLFGAVVSDVPLIDMLRFPSMGMGAAWIDEYGDPSDEAAAKVLRTYSPLHIARESVQYPPFLVTVATSDNRVGPGHARKMVARLQELGSKAYLYEDSEGGHGVSDPLSRPDLMAMRITFFVDALMGEGTH